MDELDLIGLIRETRPGNDMGVVLGMGDDAAVLEVPTGHELVASCDTLNEHVHFLPGCDAGALGHKALAVNLSDLAAMGARPAWALLSLSMPVADKDWIRHFMLGFASLADRYGVSLVGGDTCRGPLSVTVTALGLVPSGERLQRSGVEAGDLVVVSGELGGAALALQTLQTGGHVPSALLDAFQRPEPRVALGQALARSASACIDISDGLAGDLRHLALASGCRIEVDLASLPAVGPVRELEEEERLKLQLCGGDDYELCFALPPDSQAMLSDWAAQFDLRLTVIGQAVPGSGLVFRDPDGTKREMEWYGYDHFGSRL